MLGAVLLLHAGMPHMYNNVRAQVGISMAYGYTPFFCYSSPPDVLFRAGLVNAYAYAYAHAYASVNAPAMLTLICLVEYRY